MNAVATAVLVVTVLVILYTSLYPALGGKAHASA